MWKQREYNKDKEVLFLENGNSRLISRLLLQRNINPSTANAFLSSKYDDLSHPFTLHDVEKASKIFIEVAKRKGSIKTWGDYDADGIIASVMIKELCNNFGLKCECGLPSRIEQGYGLNERSIKEIKKILENDKTDLLFILDSGTNNFNEIEDIKKNFAGKLIIIDHHIIFGQVSTNADALISWHLSKNYIETCTCGQVYQLIRGIRWFTKRVNPIEYLTMASLGILADVSPIIGDNRIIVKHGLGDYALNNVVASGLTALLKTSRIYSKSISQEDVLFKIAPRINAVGRLHKPNIAFNLLIENDLATAELMADNLTEFNDQRKIIQKKIEKEAIKIVRLNPLKFEHGIVLYNPEWPIGVVGIVASKVVEEFNRPTLIIGKNGDVFKGSGRSLGHINLKEVLDLCKEAFAVYGGHSMAAGVTIKNDYIDKVNELFNQACKQYYNIHGRPNECSYYDIVIPPEEVSLKNTSLLLDTLYPYCPQFNPEPVFLLRDVTISDVKPNEGEKNGNVWKSLNFIAEKNDKKTLLRLRIFSDDYGTEISGKLADIYFTFPQTTSETFNKPPQCNIIELVIKK